MADENTVSVAAGSTTVLGHLTQFVGWPGDTFNCGGLSVPVAAIVSTSELTLAYGWPGANVTDSAAWVLMPTAPEWSSAVTLHKSVNDLLVKVRGGLPVAVNAAGPIAKRSLHDAEPEGFTFLEVTTSQDDPFRLYAKLSDVTGDWSVGQTLRGDAALSTEMAQAAAALAQAWATQEAGEVETGEGVSALQNARLARAWATQASGEVVAGEGYSAKYHAGEASDEADRAKAWATQANGEVAPGEGYSAKYHATQAAGSAGVAVGAADAASSSEAAAAGSVTVAQNWAIRTDGPVSGDEYSAKHHARAAAQSAADAATFNPSDYYAKPAADGRFVRIDTASQGLNSAQMANGQNNLGIRERLYANRTYYVRTDGNDANSGRGATSGLAFRTYQRAVNEAVTLDFNGFDVTIVAVDEGSQKIYTENVQIKPLVGGGSLHIRGAGSSKTRLTSASGNTFTQEVSGATSVSYGAMELYATTGCGIKVNYLSLASVSNDLVFGSFGDSAIWVHDSQAIMQILNADIYLIGSMKSFLFVQYGHVFVESTTINLVGSPQWSSGFITTWPRGTIQYIGNTLAGPATPVGPRRNINHMSVLNLNGQPTSVLPGSTDGSVDSSSIQM